MRAQLAAMMIAVALGNAPAAVAAKTDVLVLANGDRVTGDFKELSRGRVRLKTDDMGTIYVEWGKVESVRARRSFEVELESGERYFGSLGPASEAGRMTVTNDATAVTLDLPRVVGIAIIKTGFWSRVDGSFDLGGTYTKANELLQLTFDLDTSYRTRRYEAEVDLSSVVTRQAGDADTRRNVASLGYTRFLGGKWLIAGRGQIEANDELGLDLRSLVGALAGRYLVQTNRTLFSASAGLAANRERPSGDQPSTTNIEAIVALSLATFTYDYPHTDIELSFVAFPGLSSWGRVRFDLDLSVKRELVRHFYLNASFYDSYDNQPATDGASKNDLGATLSLGWSF